MWLRVMRKFNQLSNRSCANVKKEGGREEFVPCLKSDVEVSKLVSFVASRGSWTYHIQNLLSRDTDETQPEMVSTVFPKLSGDTQNIPRHIRCSRPRDSDFEQEWKHLSLKSVFQVRKEPSRKYPTAYAVVRDMVRSFSGPDAPGGIDDPERILQSHQYIEQGNHSSQNCINKDTEPMEGMSHDLTTLPGPSSSKYDGSIRSTLVSSSPRCGSASEGEFWSAANFTGLYHQNRH